jgi:hypothetical protein
MKKILITFLIIFISGQSFQANAYEVVGNAQASIEKTFTVFPAKIELSVGAGEIKDAILNVENRTGREQTFTISFEDFTASKEDSQTVALLGDKKGTRTLKDFLSVAQNQFTLQHGERARVPVSIALPVGIEPGGRFGAVVVSATADDGRIGSETRASTGAVVVGQIASLLFVTVPGDGEKSGELVSFDTKSGKKVLSEGVVDLRLEFRNQSSISLNPYGLITIENVFTGAKKEIGIDPWFVLPDSIRTRDIDGVNVSTGFYHAHVELNRGYENIIDQKEISFVVITPFGIAGVIFLGFLVLVLIKKVYRKYYGA